MESSFITKPQFNPKSAYFHEVHLDRGRPKNSKSCLKKRSKNFTIFDREFQKNVLLKSRALNSGSCRHGEKHFDDEPNNDSSLKPRDSSTSSKLKCSVCGIELEDYIQQRAHFKTEWHIFNVRQKVQLKETLDETSFIKLVLPENSSDSDSDETASTRIESCKFDNEEHHQSDRNAKVNFITPDKKVFSLYRCLLDISKEICKNCILHESSLRRVSHERCWIILMFSGGHFASAIFHKSDIIEHKTIHRYTVRAKRGTAQATRDSKQDGKAPRSAGATIRRQNEATLIMEIQELLKKWNEHIDHADKIFLKWPPNHRSILFGGKAPIFEKSDERIRKIPVMTGKPTLQELMKIHRELTAVKLRDVPLIMNDMNTESHSESENEHFIEDFRTSLKIECSR